MARRPLLLALALFLAALGSVNAQDYPNRPVRMILSVGAGSGPDVIARIVAEHLGRLWTQQVVVENRPGAGGAIGVRAAGTSTPDGYTLYVAVASNFIALPEIQAKLPFDVARDFVPIGFIGGHPMAIGASTGLGVRTLPELIAAAKQRPGEFNVGVATRGSLPHLTAEWLRLAGGIDLTIVHYPGAPQALADLMGGRVQLVIETMSSFAGAISAGRLTTLAVAHRAAAEIRARSARGRRDAARLSRHGVVCADGAAGHAATGRAQSQRRSAHCAHAAGGAKASGRARQPYRADVARRARALHPQPAAGVETGAH